jgi:hypothetical protein
MVSGAGRRVVAIAGVVAVAAAGAVMARADDDGARKAQDTGGLSVIPAKIERPAVIGAANVVSIANNSNEALTVAVTARPWTQSSSGLVSPNRRSELGAVAVSEDSFILAPGAKKDVSVTLRSTQSGGSAYGALEVIGLPPETTTRKGVVTGYRILGTLRYTPATRTYNIAAGSAKVAGKGSKRALAVTVRNRGNTVEPVSGTVRVRTSLGTRQGVIRDTRILPGKSVALPLLPVRGLRPGSYRASIELEQGDKTFNITKRIRVRR